MLCINITTFVLNLIFCLLSWNAVSTSATWWMLTIPPAHENAQIRNSKEARSYCDSLKYLKGSQRQFCYRHPSLMHRISIGVKSGIHECQYQFRRSKWNCSIYLSGPKHHAFKPIVKKPTREAAYINAIIASSVTYEVTKACSGGDLPDECACARIRRQDGENWGGCSDDIRFGEAVSRDFFNSKLINSTKLKNQVKLHNLNAGQKIIRKKERKICKCHGLSGACTQTVCWKTMPSLRTVSTFLKESYDGAISVKAKKRKKFRPKLPNHKKPTTLDLVYSHRSRTDFCEKNLKFGSYGTQGRLCNSTSNGNDGCGVMCCNRGFQTKVVTKRYDCKCTFEWCCRLNCQTCIDNVAESRCA